MMSIGEQRALLELVEKEQKREPAWAQLWNNIVKELKREIQQHERAIELAKKRNAAKRSRRDQRGPWIV